MEKILKYSFLLLFIYSCKTDFTPLGFCSENSLSIIGEWEWAKTVGAWTGEITTPDDLGYREKKIFDEDSTLKVYRNNIIFAVYKYSITFTDSTETSVRGTLQLFQGRRPTFLIENNTLILSEAYIDGPTSYYNRIK